MNKKANSDADTVLKGLSANDIEKVTMVNVGTPFFLPEQLKDVSHPLTLLVRYLFLVEGITLESFVQKFRGMIEVSNMAPSEMNYSRNNIKRSLKEDNVSFARLETACHICGYDIRDIELTLVHRDTNQVIKISLGEIYKFVETLNK